MIFASLPFPLLIIYSRNRGVIKILTTSEILEFILNDQVSSKKKQAKKGVAYYEGEHDIKDYKLYYYNADGKLTEDKTRSNVKISHPFFTELVDQAVQYMLSGKDGIIKSDLPELQTYLNEYFNDNENFISELYELLTGGIVKGFEYMYAYRNAENKLAFQCADSIGVVEAEKKYTSDGKDYIIFWYVERINREGQTVKRVQVWNDTETYYYTQIDDGELVKDENKGELNPRPNVIYKKDNDDNTYYEGLGYIPFFRFDNCKKQFSDLKSIKAIIDDYDLHACSLSNNLVDFDTPIYAVRGFQGNDLEELIQNVKVKKHIGLDAEGGIDVQTVDIPFQARATKLELDERNIYRFGMGLNTAQIGDGNVTNVVIKSRYALLDLKCNKLEIKLTQFLRKIVKIVIDEINLNNETDYQMKDVYFNFEREVMTNAQDNAQIELINAQRKQTEINTLLGLAETLDNETIVQNICDVLEIDYEEIKSKLPKKPDEEIDDAQNALNGVNADEQTTERNSPITA